MSEAQEKDREERTQNEMGWLIGALTPTALLRSIALSLMDSADRLAAWLVPRQGDQKRK